jgi:hypothetical protein
MQLSDGLKHYVCHVLSLKSFCSLIDVIFPAEATRPTAKDSIVAKHGSFYLCTSDMESLNEKGWLTDAVSHFVFG